MRAWTKWWNIERQAVSREEAARLLKRIASLRPSGRWNNTKLLQYTQLVSLKPIFDDLEILDLKDQNAASDHLPIGWRNAHQLPLMCSTSGIVDRHHVSFCEHPLNGSAHVGKSPDILA